MTYLILKYAHFLGLMLMSGGLIWVFVSDLRSRQIHELCRFAETVRNIQIFYDGLVVPDAALLFASGSWLIVSYYGGWKFLETPWLAGMVALFTFEFIEGNTVTRQYFVKLRRATRCAVDLGFHTPELEKIRAENVPAFTHFLDIPLLLVIIALGVFRPDNWNFAIFGVVTALVVAGLMTTASRHLYPQSL